jgi:hypothetical protein
MKPPDQTLLRLAVIKRQRAETHFAAATKSIAASQAALAAVAAGLAALDQPGGDAEAMLLAYRHGHMQRLLRQRFQLQAALSAQIAAAQVARAALKTALHSEDVLSGGRQT